MKLSPRTPSAWTWLALLFAVTAVATCSKAEPEVMMRVETVVTSLVSTELSWKVLEEQEDAPVRTGTPAPMRAFKRGTSPLPALEMPPRARVRLQLDSLPRGETLRFWVGFDKQAYQGDDAGEVRYEISSDQGVPFTKVLPYGKGVPDKQRVWHEAEVDLRGLDQLELSTECVSGEGTPPAAFALLQVVNTSERPRTRATLEQPNVVLILVDTLRDDRMSCNGGLPELTPVVDELAEGGVLFESAFVTAPWTWPSTASILTSLHVPEHGVSGYASCYLSQDLTTLAEVLQSAGWTTGAFTANPLIHSDKEFDQGFETFEESWWAAADPMVDHGIEWLQENAEWRFFLYLHLTDPHEYKPQPRFREAWASEEPADFGQGMWRKLVADMHLKEEYDAAQLDEFTSHMLSLYDATVAEFDAALGRLVAEVERLGVAENTVYVLTSDHGEEFLDHGTMYHGNHLHRELIGVPLIFSGPGVPAGVRVSEGVENRFIAPTILSLVGLERQGNVQGPDLLDLDVVRRGSAEPMFQTTNRAVWLQDDGPPLVNLHMHGLRFENHLFMWVPKCADGSSRRALFDLSLDPEAKTDVSGEHPDECGRYEKWIQEWLDRGEAVRPAVSELERGRRTKELIFDTLPQMVVKQRKAGYRELVRVYRIEGVARSQDFPILLELLGDEPEFTEQVRQLIDAALQAASLGKFEGETAADPVRCVELLQQLTSQFPDVTRPELRKVAEAGGPACVATLEQALEAARSSEPDK